jgi:putative DNA primase/helicase
VLRNGAEAAVARVRERWAGESPPRQIKRKKDPMQEGAVVNGGANGRERGWRPADWVVRLDGVEPWGEPVEGKALLDELARTVERFVVLPRWAAEAVALWVVHTYAFDLRDVTTYLGIESPQHRCGKSTLLDVLGLLVKRPVRAANISSSAFFRVIAETQPALLIDEADTFLYSDELRGILNSGYQRNGAFVMRVTSEVASGDDGGRGNGGAEAAAGGQNGPAGSGRLVKYSCWCPKAIARIGRLPQTLADRCIVFVMQRKLPGEKCDRLKSLEAGRLGRQCERFVRDHAEGIRVAVPVVPEGLNDRAADIWEPLLVLADLAGGEWPERARQAAVGLSARAQEGDPMGSLLIDILDLFLRSGKERLFTRTMAEWLSVLEDRPWAALKKGKGVTGQWLAQQLQGYGIRPKTMRMGEDRAKGYEAGDFREVFRRYIPKGDLEVYKAELKEWATNAATNAPEEKPTASGEPVGKSPGEG